MNDIIVPYISSFVNGYYNFYGYCDFISFTIDPLFDKKPFCSNFIFPSAKKELYFPKVEYNIKTNFLY